MLRLTAAVAVEIGSLRAQIAALKEQEKELVDQIKDRMQAEKIAEFAPKASPFKLVYNEYDRATVPWKKEFETLATEHYGAVKAQKIIKTLVMDNQSVVRELEVKQNENWDKNATNGK